MGETQQCQRCKHIWDYNGKAKYVTSCPSCKTSVMLRLGEIN